MAWTYPHEFHDGTGEVASGVQVNDNFTRVREKVEAQEAGGAGAGARTERALNTAFIPSTTANTIVHGDVQLEPTTSFGAVATVWVNGVQVMELFAHESIGHPIRVPFTLWVPRGATYAVLASGHVGSLHTSHSPTS